MPGHYRGGHTSGNGRRTRLQSLGVRTIRGLGWSPGTEPAEGPRRRKRRIPAGTAGRGGARARGGRRCRRRNREDHRQREYGQRQEPRQRARAVPAPVGRGGLTQGDHPGRSSRRESSPQAPGGCRCGRTSTRELGRPAAVLPPPRLPEATAPSFGATPTGPPGRPVEQHPPTGRADVWVDAVLPVRGSSSALGRGSA